MPLHVRAQLRIVTASFSIKATSYGTNNILLRKYYWKLGKMNARFWNNIWNKSKVTLDSFRNFAYVSSYLHLKSFAWKKGKKMKKPGNSTNVMKLTKAILKSSYRVLQVASKWKTLKKTCLFLGAVEFWPAIDIQISITLTIFWVKLKTTFFRRPTEVSQNTQTFMSTETPITK